MSESRSQSGPDVNSRFQAIVVAVLRAKQLRRGSKPRIELDYKRHKDTSIAMEEVRRGLVAFTPFAKPHLPDPGAMRDLNTDVGQSLPVVS